MSDLKQKYVIVGDEFLMGRVRFHREIDSKADCGGFWFYVEETNSLFLYGTSTDFGGAMQEDIDRVMDSIKFRMGEDITVHYKPCFYLMDILKDHMDESKAIELMEENDWV